MVALDKVEKSTISGENSSDNVNNYYQELLDDFIADRFKSSSINYLGMGFVGGA